MWAMREYIYDMQYRYTPVENRPDFEEWKLSWQTRDMTRHSPMQENDDDCGVFTILSIYLISRGVRLQRSSYNQNIVTNRKLRRCIALALMKCRSQLQVHWIILSLVNAAAPPPLLGGRRGRGTRHASQPTRLKLGRTLLACSCHQIKLTGFQSIENAQQSHFRTGLGRSLQSIRCYNNPQRKQRPT